MKSNKLPNKPSKLLKIALHDMEITIEQGCYIDMSDWVHFEDPKNTNTKICATCFAGAVMLQRRKDHFIQSGNSAFYPSNDEVNRYKYGFLDNIRRGRLSSAMKCLKIIHPFNKKDPYAEHLFIEELPNWIQYSIEKHNKFVKQVKKLILYFENLGL